MDGVEVLRFDSTNRSDFLRVLDTHVRPLATSELDRFGGGTDEERGARARAAAIAARGLAAARNHHHVTARVRGVVERALDAHLGLLE